MTELATFARLIGKLRLTHRIHSREARAASEYLLDGHVESNEHIHALLNNLSRISEDEIDRLDELVRGMLQLVCYTPSIVITRTSRS